MSLLFRASDTIEMRLKNLNAIGIDVYLLDKTSGLSADRLYFHPSRTRRENIRPLEETALKHEPLLWVKDLDMAGRKWSLVCVPAPAFFSRYYEIWQPWVALAGGLFLTLLLAYYLFTTVNRTAKIQRLVDERTAELRKNEENLRKLSRAIEQSPSVVVITDTKGDIEYVNPKFTQLTGYAAEEVIGKNSRILRSGEMPSEEYKHLWETVIAGREWQGELHNRKKNGQLYWESASISAIRSPQGVAEHYLKVSEDITERKRLERLKDEFVSNVSHELRTPLSIIKEAINLILDKIVGEVNQRQENVLVTAKDNIDRLTRIINELLDISKLEAGKLQLKKDNVDIVALIKKTVSSFKGKAGEKGLELKQNFSPAKIMLFIDADKITEVFINLLGNAVKFTDKGCIEISAEDKGSEVECFVRDTGIGIAEENLPKVFDKFQQFDRVSGPGERGTGLGLSIVKGIIEMHNGNIRVESRCGEGTKFTFVLPKSAAGIS